MQRLSIVIPAAIAIICLLLMSAFGSLGAAGLVVVTLPFALVMAVAVYVILDVEYPRLGLIRVDAFDQAMIDLRESMNRDIPSPGQK